MVSLTLSTFIQLERHYFFPLKLPKTDTSEFFDVRVMYTQ